MKEELGIDDWLELVKEDKNLKGAYISFSQYMYLLEKENQELNQKYLNAVADYEMVMSELQELKEQLKYHTPDENSAYFKGKNESKMKINRLRGEIKELKEEKQEWINLLDMFKNQQRKFINYLENMLDDENDIFSVVRVKDVLSKYQEIIGGKE